MGKKKHKKRYMLGLFIIFILLALLFPHGSLAAPKDDTKITVVYFYENACNSCNPKGEFIELFNQLVGEKKGDAEIELLMYNTFHTSGSELIKEYFKDFNVPKDKQSQTMVFIGDSFLSGQSEIESRLKGELIKAKESIVNSSSPESSHNPSSQEIPLQEVPSEEGPSQETLLSDIPTIQYFHVTACSSCLEVEKFLDTIQNINIQEFNISESESLDLVKYYFEIYEVPEEEQSVPIIFIGDTYLSGEKTIKESLINKIEEGQGLSIPVSVEARDKDQSTQDGLSGYGIIGVIFTGFINGLNPCSISMLLFFLSMLTIRSVSALRMGFAFITGKFITYFLLGTLLFNIFIKLNIPWFQTSIKVIMALLLFLIALLNIGDLYAAHREDYSKVRMQLPTFLRRKNHQWIKKISSIENHKILMPVSFGLGVLVSFGEFLCTGQIYLATIISVLHNSKTLDFRAIMYFLLYGFAFVVPLILITVLIHKGRELFDLTEWMREKMPIIKLINAIVFILFGILVLIWF